MSNDKNSFWENMWLFIIVLLIIGLIHNLVEWVIKCIKTKDWISLTIWIIVTYLACLFFNLI